MLSGETTTGLYPIEAVKVLDNIIGEIEPSVEGKLNPVLQLVEPKRRCSGRAALLAQDLGNSGIIVFTRSGLSCICPWRAASSWCADLCLYRYRSPISTNDVTMGGGTFLMKFSDDPEQTIVDAMSYLKDKGWCEPGTWLVVITNALASSKVIDTLQIRQLE